MSDTETNMVSPGETPLPASSPPAAAAVASPEAAVTPKGKSTPKKRAAKTKKEKKEEANDDDDGDEEENATPKKKVKATPAKERQRKAPAGKPANARQIPRCYDECGEADKALLDMRDAGKGWTEIRAEWKRITGDDVGSSTLPNRYTRLKSNFTVIKEEDNARLLEAKVQVEDAFEKEKWGLISQAMEKIGADSYKADVLHKQYKKLMVQQAHAAPPVGVQDKDFDVKIDDESE